LVSTLEQPSVEHRTARRAALRPVVVAVPAVTLALAFRAGGFFPAVTGLAAIAVAILLLLRVTLAAHPFAGWTRAAGAAALALASFASWTLASALW
jgi:hypothetical protein